jgi:CRISPR-associated helicase Cas3/CRISPR-associated endonuclease Cas3-HD
MEYLAHSAGPSGKPDPLRCHSRNVAERAAAYAEPLGAAREAYLTGLLHDAGKYGSLFQRRLEGKERGIDHWSAGAWLALTLYKNRGVAAALAIQGHHIGLQQASKDSLGELNPARLTQHHPLNLRLSEADVTRLLSHMRTDGLALPDPEELPNSLYSGLCGASASAMLDVRMLFSTLVDADFIETEAHFTDGGDSEGGRREAGPALQPEDRLALLLDHLKEMARSSRASRRVNQLRADLLTACLDAAALPRGLFTLTAPTGTGKTLSSLAFAMKHAMAHKLRRIVMVIPYLTIIEQTVRAYRQVFEPHLGKEAAASFILEHHSLAGTRPADAGAGSEQDSEDPIHRSVRLLAENWDAPIVVTTNVQFLESLFSNRPAPCRKLHRLAESVILLDEVQSMPPHLAIPTLATLTRLAGRYRATVVFSTATQPAFEHLSPWVRKYSGSDWRAREIVPPELGLFERARRTEVEWPDFERPLTWSELASELMEEDQVLCVLNLKRHALALHAELQGRKAEGLLHLSTNMCPAHRLEVLNEVRARLDRSEACRLVSTQCVEAGADLDFPAVYRALAPLEAIAQAGGRCNRNGRNRVGSVKVFIPEEEAYPDGTYRQAAGITRLLLKKHGSLNLDDPSVYADYYRQFFDVSKPENRKQELQNAIEIQHFALTAREYRVIEQNAVNVLVCYDPAVFRQLADEVRRTGLTRQWTAMARPHSIGLFRPRDDDAVRRWLEPVPIVRGRQSDEWFIYLNEDHYDPQRGLVPPAAMDCLIA